MPENMAEYKKRLEHLKGVCAVAHYDFDQANRDWNQLLRDQPELSMAEAVDEVARRIATNSGANN